MMPDRIDLEGKKVLVTGGSGFVGTNVIRKLLEERADVSATYHSKIRFPQIGVNYMKADLTNVDDAKRVTKGMDCVVLTAAFCAGAEGMLADPLALVTDTIIINLRTLKAAKENGVRKCIYVSSGMVYPYKDTPLTEEEGFDGDPFDKYFTGGWSRRSVETVCRMYAEKLKLMDITVVRVDNVYGPYDNFQPERSHVMPSLIKKAVDKMDPYEVWGDGKDYKDFTYVEDLAEGIILALKKADGYQVYNIVSGRNYTINEVLRMILCITGYENACIRYNNKKPMMVPYKVVSNEKAKNELGFEAETSIEDGITKTVKWYMENQESFL